MTQLHPAAAYAVQHVLPTAGMGTGGTVAGRTIGVTSEAVRADRTVGQGTPPPSEARSSTPSPSPHLLSATAASRSATARSISGLGTVSAGLSDIP
jgi:hypothetical protein